MLLEVQELSKVYQLGDRTFSAVKDVNLAAEPGDFISILGRSGSGKSTLLNLIAGLLLPTSGAVVMRGRSLSALTDSEVSRLRNTDIGYITQGQSTLSNLTVLDNVRLPFYFFKREGDPTRRALALLEQVGIAHLADAYPRHLSGGELRRVSIARALMNAPALLLADEPTSDLDAQTTSEVMQIFAEIARGGTAVLLVTHELDTTSYGNTVLTMDGGVLRDTPKASPATP